MYMCVWLYNTLNQWVRRNKKLITNLAISIGIMMIPIGVILGATESIEEKWIWFIGFIGFASLIWAAYEARKEDKERKEFIKVFKALATKMGVDVDKVLKK